MRRGWADDLRKVSERQKKNKSNDDEEDDCVILDGDPYKASDRVGNVSGNESDELVVVAEKGQIACRDYPHARHLCVTFPFNTHPHEKYCHLCHCYVCDTLSPCFYWGTGKSSDDHCHSTDKEEVWRELRQRSKEEGKLAQLPVSSLLETTLSNESLPHQTLNCCQPLNINEERVVELDMVSLALDQSVVQGDRLTGTVKWFDSHKGYGFITREDGGEDLFVHHSSIKSKGHKSLAEGEKVEFAIDIDNHGRGKAINVSGPGGSFVQGSSGGDNGCMEFSARGGRIPGNRIYGGRTSGSSRPGGSFVQGSSGGDNGCMEFSARGGRIPGNRIYGGRTSGSCPGGSFVQGSSGGDNGCMEFSARGGRIPGNRIYGGRTSGSSRHGEYGRNKDVGASSFGGSMFQGSTKDNNYGNSDTDALTGHLARNCSGRGGGNDNNFRVRVARGGGREDYGSRASGSYRGGDYGRNRATGVSGPGESFLQETTRENDSNSNSDTLKCFNCGEFGHLTRNCDGGGSGSNVLNGRGDLGRNRAAGVSNLDKSTFQGITRDNSYYDNVLREREIHVCSKCGELGHSMRDCVVGGNNDSNNRQRGGFDGGTNRGRGRYFNFSNNRYNETNRAVAQRSSSGNLVRGSTRGSNHYGERGNSARDHHSLERGGGGCYICGKPGHQARDCYKESGGGRSEDGISSCTSGEAGHLPDWS